MDHAFQRFDKECGKSPEKAPPARSGERPAPARSPDGPGAFHPSEGQTIEAEICERKCHEDYLAYARASLAALNADEAAARANAGAKDAATNAADLAKRLADAEAAREKASAILHTPITGVPPKQEDLNWAHNVYNTDLAPLTLTILLSLRSRLFDQRFFCFLRSCWLRQLSP